MKQRKQAFLHEEVGETSAGQKRLWATEDEVVYSRLLPG